MKKCKITVLKTTLDKKLAEECGVPVEQVHELLR